MASCNNDDDNVTNDSQDNVILNSDSQSLNERVKYDNSGALEIISPLGGRNQDVPTTNMPLALVAEINPPVL